MMLVTMVDVVGRYGFNSPIPGSYEFNQFLLGGAAFFAFAYVQHVKGHITIDFVRERLSVKGGEVVPEIWTESRLACKVIPSVARIDKEKCTGCGICLKPAHCFAITMEDGKALVAEEECLGCGTCFLFCPAEAISMIEI